MRLYASFILVPVLGVLVIPTLGDEPDPKEIISKVGEKLRAIKAVSYKVEAWGEAGLKDALPRVRATVEAKQSNDPRFPLLRLRGTVTVPTRNETQPFHVVLGEQEAIWLDEAQKVCVVGKLPDGADLVDQPMQLVFVRKFLHPAPFAFELLAGSLKYEGERTIGGTACHVIHVVRPGVVGESRWYFGVNDFLPHRVDRILEVEGGKGTHVLELSDLDTAPKFDDTTFATNVPEGYERRTYERPLTADSNLLPVGSKAPDWTLKAPDGTSVSLAKLRGKVVVLDFWASWCLPCLQAMPSVQRLYEKFKDKPVAVFGINVGERSPDVDPAAFMKKHGFTYGLLLNGADVSLAYRVVAIPTFYVIGPDGKIVHAAAGLDPAREKELEKIIEALLEKKG
jgi:peroxiredoxin